MILHQTVHDIQGTSCSHTCFRPASICHSMLGGFRLSQNPILLSTFLLLTVIPCLPPPSWNNAIVTKIKSAYSSIWRTFTIRVRKKEGGEDDGRGQYLGKSSIVIDSKNRIVHERTRRKSESESDEKGGRKWGHMRLQGLANRESREIEIAACSELHPQQTPQQFSPGLPTLTVH